MKARHVLQVYGTIVAVILFLSCMIVAASFLTGLIYQQAGIQFPPVLVQVINSFLGLWLGFTVLYILGRVLGSRFGSGRVNWLRQIIRALERIAQGDFSVRLDHSLPEDNPMGELAKSVNTMASELEAMEKMRQEFISNVSHEIQSPLTSIRGFALALHNDQLMPEERRHYLEIIEAESQRLSRISDNLLKLASLDSKQVRFEPKHYRLDKQVRNLILACEPQWAGKQIDLGVSLEEIMITADEDLLSQVWTNLVYNSIKFTPEGGKISVTLCQQGRQAEFKITDTGIGISAQDQARVFERFYKADPSRQRSVEGSGLGLAIAKKIVEMHRGTINVESQLGMGTTFAVTLPTE